MEKTLTEEEINTDVLVVGAGAGGMMAAIGAADLGADVTLCEVGNARRSGGIMGGNDHFMCFVPEIHSPQIKEMMIRQIQNYFGGEEHFYRQCIELTYDVLEMWGKLGHQYEDGRPL